MSDTQTNAAGEIIPLLEQDRLRIERDSVPQDSLPVNMTRNVAGELIPLQPTDRDFVAPTE